MSFGISIGDFIAVGQLTFNLYRQCYLVARGAPQEFQFLVSELTTLSTSIRILEEEVQNQDSILVHSGEDRVRMVQEMMKRVEETLLELQKFATKYEKLRDPSRSKTKKIWDKVKWSVDMPEIDALRNKLVYHNGVIHLLLTSAGNSSLHRLESVTVNIDRRLSNIKDLINKSQNNSTQLPVLSGEAIKGETSLLKYEFSEILMKNAETLGRWNAIGINDWIKAGRWWLLKYQYQSQRTRDLGSGGNGTVSRSAYTNLIKSSWILTDVITKHPQLNLLETTIQYHVQSLAQEIDEEFKKIDIQGLRTPRLQDLDHSELYVWETATIEATQHKVVPGKIFSDILEAPGAFSSGPIRDTGYSLVLQRFGYYQHHTGRRVPCFIQLIVHQHEKDMWLLMFDQGWKLQQAVNINPNSRSTICYEDEGILSIDGQSLVMATDQGAILHLILCALVEYIWWYRCSNKPQMKTHFLKTFCMIFAFAFGYTQFINSPDLIEEAFTQESELNDSSDEDQLGLVQGGREILKNGAKSNSWKNPLTANNHNRNRSGVEMNHRYREVMDGKGEILLPWMARTHVNRDLLHPCQLELYPQQLRYQPCLAGFEIFQKLFRQGFLE